MISIIKAIVTAITSLTVVIAFRKFLDENGTLIFMRLYRKAVVQAEGGRLYGTEIFLHESCIYMDVLHELLKNEYFVWQVYDSWYARKEGVTQDEYSKYVAQLAEQKANAYIGKYILKKSAA